MRRLLPAVDQRASLERAPGRAPIYASSLRTVTTRSTTVRELLCDRTYRHPWMDGVCNGRRDI